MPLNAQSLPGWLPQFRTEKPDTDTLGTMLGGFVNMLTPSQSGQSDEEAQRVTDPSSMGEAAAAGGNAANGASGSGGGSSDDTGTSAYKSPNAPGDPLAGMPKWRRAFAEAQLAQKDPMWRLHAAQTQAATMSTIAGAEQKWQDYNLTSLEAAKKTRDIPKIAAWSETLKTDPSAPIPVVESEWGVQTARRMQQDRALQDIQHQKIGVQTANEKINVEREKRKTDWSNAIASDHELMSEIDGLPNQGWNVDADGNQLSPSKEALAIYNQKMTEGGKYPERAFGFKSNSAITAQMRGQNAQTLDQQKAAERMIYDQQRQADRKEIQAIGQKNKIDLLGLSHTSTSGRIISEQEFVNRHYNSVLQTVIKNWDEDSMGKVNPQRASQSAMALLKKTYGALKPPATTNAAPAAGQSQVQPAVSPQAQPATVAPAVVPATTNAPAANSKDPLGLFSQ